MCSTKKLVFKSRFDTDQYSNDAVQFFYGEIEPYYVEEVDDFAIFFGGGLFANDLIVEPLPGPTAQIYYLDYTYTPKEKLEVEEPQSYEHYRNVAKKHHANNNKLRKKVKYANYNIFQRRR